MAIYKYIESVEDLISTTEELIRDNIVLFRGQNCNEPLLPKVARKNPNVNTTTVEKKTLNEFRRRLAHNPLISGLDEWDLMVYAQHYGLATRLLDWTSNPLFALWFACCDYNNKSDGFIYMLQCKEKMVLEKGSHKSPFKIDKTYILKPSLNNERIVAQNGWFTVSRYSQTSKMFVDLHYNKSIDGKVLMKGIPADRKLPILQSLDKLGVNFESVYPSAEGTANYLNWLHRDNF